MILQYGRSDFSPFYICDVFECLHHQHQSNEYGNVERVVFGTCDRSKHLDTLQLLLIPLPTRLQPRCYYYAKTILAYVSTTVARYTFIQLNELEQRVVNEIVHALTQQQEDLNPDPHD